MAQKQKTPSGAPPHDGGNDGTPFKGAGTHIRYSIDEFIPILVATAAKIADASKGREQLKTLMTSAFHSKFASEEERKKGELTVLEKDFVFIEQSLDKARQKDAITPEYLPASKINHGRNTEDHEETKFRDWQYRHKFEAILLLTALPIALGSSAYTAWANLVGTGLTVFLENPILPASMAALAPMASFSFKTIWHSLQSYEGQRLFTRLLNGTAVILILIWAVLFADQFHGLGSSNVTSGLFDEPSAWQKNRETLFTAVTLVTEMVVGTVLAHRLDKIAAGYSPNYWVRNPDSESARAEIVVLEMKRDGLLERVTSLSGDLAAYPASLSLQIELALLSYDAKRSAVEEETL